MYPSIKKFVEEPLFAQHRHSDNKIRKIDQEIRKMSRKLSLNQQSIQFQTFVSVSLNQFRQLNDGLQFESSEANKVRFCSRNAGLSPRITKAAKSNHHRPSEACLPLLEKNLSQTKLPSLQKILAVEQLQILELFQTTKLKNNNVASKVNVLKSKNNILNAFPIKSFNCLTKATNYKVSNRASINNRLKQLEPTNELLKGGQNAFSRQQNYNDFYRTLKDENASPNIGFSNNGVMLQSDEMSQPKLLPDGFKKIRDAEHFGRVVAATFDGLPNSIDNVVKQRKAYSRRLKFRKTNKPNRLSFDCSLSGSQTSTSPDPSEENDQPCALNSACKDAESRRSQPQSKKSISQDIVPNSNVKLNPNRWKEDMKRFSSFLKRFVNNTPNHHQKPDEFSNPYQQLHGGLDFSYLKRVSHSRYLSNNLAHKNIQKDSSDFDEAQEQSKSDDIDNFIIIQEEFIMARCPMSNMQNNKVFQSRFSPPMMNADCYNSQWMILIDKLNQEERITHESQVGLYELNNQVYGQSLQKRFTHSETLSSLIGVLSHVANNIHSDHCRILGGA